jgi:hypothetical protein
MLRRILLSHLLALAALATVGIARPASAGEVTFAEFFQTNPPRTFSFNGTKGTFGTTVSTPVIFQYLGVSVPSALEGPLAAHMTISGSTTAAATNSSGVLNQPITGVTTIRFTLDHPYNGLSNLLSVMLQPASFEGIKGASTGALLSSTASGDSIAFTSDFLHFANNQAGNGVAISLDSITPTLSINGSSHYLSSFTATTTGSFSTATPEPSSLVLAGLGGVALASYGWRRRRRS